LSANYRTFILVGETGFVLARCVSFLACPAPAFGELVERLGLSERRRYRAHSAVGWKQWELVTWVVNLAGQAIDG